MKQWFVYWWVLVSVLGGGCALLREDAPVVPGPILEVRELNGQVYYILDEERVVPIADAVLRYMAVEPLPLRELNKEVFLLDGYCWATPWAVGCWMGPVD